MNSRIVAKIIGVLLILEALMMVPSLIISIIYKEQDGVVFAMIIPLIALVGFLLSKIQCETKLIKVREGFAIVAFGWVVFSLFGSLPFYLSGSIPSFVDAFFETVSGFTTTGASILTEIESLPKGVLFWRSFTHWNGGMGILVFTVALLPKFGVGGFQIFKAESPGPVVDKIAPRINDYAKILYKTYIFITLLQISLLWFAGMNLYDAAVHTFGTVGTGGFSTKNLSVGAYDSPLIQMIIAVFMVVAGVNFSLYYALYKGKWSMVVKDRELRLYLGIVAVATFLITLNISPLYGNMLESGKYAFFQVGSIISTTGYATTDFNLWPTFSKAMLMVLMFVGGCAGSTSGSVKTIRILVLFKLIGREIARIFHPRAVIPVKLGKTSLQSNTVNSIVSFFVLYLLLFVTGTLVISLEGLDLESSASAVAATLGNIGPGFGIVGPTGNYSGFSDFSKLFLSFLMLLGRLELFTIIALIEPKRWIEEF
ncbi:Trk system potassium uptake protein TrkH [Petrocella atlantisensis]|uniref:Trk system potassium uptake protein TrkH n=1 Tax=Petrocella atlantisensis TaxID=2173034 RepID=A0A3P7PAT7_9FIRM|nr:potassium transporter TrkG [Petrocella atlantisensis]PKM53890.1 MAG: potassium transporter KefA [Firmicutes bacterium HGW-Firmicutes-5]VDN46038.1 Trk system potassium uptake protein TrkH [Petrocella atlantisensis]